MRLKEIKLSGFKSFVDTTRVKFPEQMTCVVGPNGCGKSNIIDAVRWVLGESSAKNLRGDDITDVIFNGSTQRKPVSMASVELIFENTLGKLQGLFSDRAEISIRRVVTRDKKSTYEINGQKCRRKDITEIFLGTGMGARSYSIIEQGMISKLIESKPQELRVFLEEAAGISKYKERRKETENRIKHTRENLARLEDVRHEIGKNIQKLQVQAANAKKYTELKAEERKLKSQLAVFRYKIATDLSLKAEADAAARITEIEKFRTEQTHSETTLIKLEEDKKNISEQHDEQQKKYYGVEAEIAKTDQQIINNKQQQERLKASIQNHNAQLAELTQQIDDEKNKLEELESELKFLSEDGEAYNMEVEELAFKLEEAENILAENQSDLEQHLLSKNEKSSRLSSLSSKINSDNEAINRATSRIQSVENELGQISTEHVNEQLGSIRSQLISTEAKKSKAKDNQTKLEISFQELVSSSAETDTKLSEAKDNYSNAKAERKSLQFIQETCLGDKEAKDAVEGLGIAFVTVLEQLKVEPQWQKAVESALSFLNNPIIIDNHKLTTEIPGLAYITSGPNDRTKNTLGSTIISGHYPAIFDKISTGSNSRELFGLSISAEGVISHSNWTSSPGKASTDGFYERQQRIIELDQIIAALESEINVLTTQKAEIIESIENIKQDIDKLKAEVHQFHSDITISESEIKHLTKELERASTHKAKLTQELNESNLFIEQMNERIFNATDELEQLQADQLELSTKEQQFRSKKEQSAATVTATRSDLEKAKTKKHQFELEKQNLASDIRALQTSYNRSKDSLHRLNEDHEEHKAELEELLDPLMILEEKQQELLTAHKSADDSLTVLKQKLSELESQIQEEEKGHDTIRAMEEKIRREAEELKFEAQKHTLKAQNYLEPLKELNLSIKDVAQDMPEHITEEEWDDRLNRTIAQVQRMGAVNLAAIDEYEQQSKRKEYLDQQNDDLTGALETLQSAIDKIDKETRAKFKETFDSVNEDLKVLFPKVFGGGTAYLELTDSNLLEAGVTIMARPPGKKNSTIHLLSGGEKALTALSLVFSIFNLNPAPFCMLDEVDAPLDDVNVGRFCKLVQGMSESVQFIYISHNKVAMEMAHQLAGVTMHEAGVSRLVAVDIEEASKLIS